MSTYLCIFGYICTSKAVKWLCKDCMAPEPKILPCPLKKFADPCFSSLRVALIFAIWLDLLCWVEGSFRDFCLDFPTINCSYSIDQGSNVEWCHQSSSLCILVMCLHSGEMVTLRTSGPLELKVCLTLVGNLLLLGSHLSSLSRVHGALSQSIISVT